VKTVLAWVAVFVMTVSGLWAEDVTERGAAGVLGLVAAGAADRTPRLEEPVKPWIHKSMSAPVRGRLEAGFELALERVEKIEACGDLFTRLGANGLEMLRDTLYFPVDSYRREIEVCGRNPTTNSLVAENLAYTKVGARTVWICRNFAHVSTEDAAAAVIHEALHFAGLSEQPIDRLAMTSVEITEMVKDSCGF